MRDVFTEGTAAGIGFGPDVYAKTGTADVQGQEHDLITVPLKGEHFTRRPSGTCRLRDSQSRSTSGSSWASPNGSPPANATSAARSCVAGIPMRTSMSPGITRNCAATRTAAPRSST